MKHYLVQRQGSKWIAIGMCANATCSAHADSAFIRAGLPNQWKTRGVNVVGEYVTQQKNFAGISPQCIDVVAIESD